MTLRGEFDKLHGKLDSIEKVQVQQASSIEHHIARTDALEKMITPIYKAHQQGIGALKFLGVISVICGIIFGAIKLFL
jgi:hypothetical protein